MRRRATLAALAALALGACKGPGGAVGPDDFPDVLVDGNRSIAREELLEAALDHVVDYEETDVGKAAIDDAAYRIELHYRERGYAFAVVDYAIFPESSPEVVFTVDEGPRVVLAELEIAGAEALGEAPVRALVAGSVGAPGEAPFVRRALDQAADLVAAEARTLGYADARVEVEVDEIDRDRGAARARLLIDAGPLHVIRAVELVPAEGESLPIDLGDETRAPIGERYTVRRVAGLLARIEKRLQDAGYPDARAEVLEQAVADGNVELRVGVRVGPLVTITEVRFEGDLSSHRAFLDDLVGLERGDRYSAEEVGEAFRRIYATGLFSSVEHRLEPAEGPQRALVWEMDELPSLELWSQPGWGSYDGPRISAGLREHNLLGSGWVLRTEGTLADKTKRAEVGVTDPYFFTEDLSFDVMLSYARREEPSFEFEEGSLETTLRRRWTEELSTAVSYRFQRSNLIAEDIDLVDPDEVPSDFDVSAIKLSVINDTRDNLLSPHAGARIEVAGEWADAALGSEVDFVRGNATVGLFHELRPTTVLALRAAAGAIVPIHDAVEIPLQERYFLGGESSVRSFAESELGPKDGQKNPLGGEAYTLGTIELRQSLPRSFGVAAFVDAGNLQESYADLFSGNDYRYAIGVGLRYELPVGSLRLDFGWNPRPKEDEDDYAIHFSIGHAF